MGEKGNTHFLYHIFQNFLLFSKFPFFSDFFFFT
jgi:hypothetical protein